MITNYSAENFNMRFAALGFLTNEENKIFHEIPIINNLDKEIVKIFHDYLNGWISYKNLKILLRDRHPVTLEILNFE